MLQMIQSLTFDRPGIMTPTASSSDCSEEWKKLREELQVRIVVAVIQKSYTQQDMLAALSEADTMIRSFVQSEM